MHIKSGEDDIFLQFNKNAKKKPKKKKIARQDDLI